MPFFYKNRRPGKKHKLNPALPETTVKSLEGMDKEQRESYIFTRINELALMLERLNLSEYLNYINEPWRVIRQNFMAGLSKGFGMAIGFVLLSALTIAVLQQIAAANWPYISDFLAEIIKSVQVKMMLWRF